MGETKMMSPAELNEDRTRWLGIPHDMHGSLQKLMNMLFPDFSLEGIHCLQCEGEPAFEVTDKVDGKRKLCTGYVDKPETLLFLVDIADVK